MPIRRRKNESQLNYKNLESRQMLATVVVNTPVDIVDANDGLTSLREAVVQANADNSVDVITFDSSIAGQPVVLDTILPILSNVEITIDGDLNDDSVADITIQGVDGISGISRQIFDERNVFTINESDIQFDGLTFSGFSNTVGELTGVVGGSRSTVSFINNNFDGNNITGDTVLVAGTIISGGDSLLNFSIDVDIFIDNSSFTNNTSLNSLISLFSTALLPNTLTIQNSTFDNNISERASIISAGNSTTVIDNSSITNNSGVSGTLFASGISLEVTNSVFAENENGSAGGAIFLTRVDALISNSLIVDNVAEFNGGGIFRLNNDASDGSLTVVNSTISGNSAGISGGGFFGSGTFVNTTITGNSAGSSGGGIEPGFTLPINTDPPFLSLENSIVLGNSATNSNDIGNFQTTNAEGFSIVGSDVSLSLSSLSGIIVADPTEVFAETEGNIGNSTILAGVLADNGGPFQSVALLNSFSNPALDVGTLPDGVATDAAGNPRSFDLAGVDNGGTVDAGAFELQNQVNFPPVFADESITVDVPENTQFVADLNVTDDNDSEGAGITFAITGGADASAFSVNIDTGELQFVTAPDFETPGSSELSNSFSVEVTATNSNGLSDSQTVLVNVTDEATVIALTLDQTSVSEDGSVTATLTRSGDTSGALTVSLTSSNDTVATVPAAVTFADGQTVATFVVTAVDDDLVDGDQLTTIAATTGPLTVSADLTCLLYTSPSPRDRG